MRVVFDTNVFISGLQYGGKPEIAMQFAAIAGCTLIASEEILLEIEDVLVRKFRWSQKNVASSLSWIRSFSDIVMPDITLNDCSDPDDNRILEAAITGKADFIVSGDRHLLRLKRFRGIDIIEVKDFIDHIAV